ncbi:hypothetical protein [Cellulomonas sp. SLBN-39]|uniref:hypothetical protein n=1 Tax=Cellulomonas sp. SLBN-39 TaxID=2768446 RepID=UPI00114F76D8|nr:hypothetical protein [Cellulomonas sp. SLBN-39]TQL03663.1 hypothetical protein FBY24_2764 [Cellulomonas sp. SLBN-39]
MRRRRSPALVALVLVLSACGAGTGGATQVDPADEVRALPRLGAAEVVVEPDGLDYSPTGEVVFPSLFHAGEHLAEPLGEWYLYTAPHEVPGGVVLLVADTLDGPWVEHPGGPVVSASSPPHFDVSHVSSPDVVWHDETSELFLYFHGENSTTRYATSRDGVSFTYGGEAVWNSLGGEEVTESSYARVFEHPDPSSGFRWAMFYMTNSRDDVRRIRLAESIDGRSWVVDEEPVIEPGPGDGGNVSGANLWTWRGQHFVVYHTANGRIMARPVGVDLRPTSGAVVLLDPDQAVDVDRVAAPEPVEDGGVLYLFFEAGDRLDAQIQSVRTAP